MLGGRDGCVHRAAGDRRRCRSRAAACAGRGVPRAREQPHAPLHEGACAERRNGRRDGCGAGPPRSGRGSQAAGGAGRRGGGQGRSGRRSRVLRRVRACPATDLAAVASSAGAGVGSGRAREARPAAWRGLCQPGVRPSWAGPRLRLCRREDDVGRGGRGGGGRGGPRPWGQQRPRGLEAARESRFPVKGQETGEQGPGRGRRRTSSRVRGRRPTRQAAARAEGEHRGRSHGDARAGPPRQHGRCVQAQGARRDGGGGARGRVRGGSARHHIHHLARGNASRGPGRCGGCSGWRPCGGGRVGQWPGRGRGRGRPARALGTAHRCAGHPLRAPPARRPGVLAPLQAHRVSPAHSAACQREGAPAPSGQGRRRR
mmetsp:Transcript_14680/g.55309  ORF Transcript_14680/g.55309 Transcript_14680/m.55309 type:complete len:372 (+) Transcript_14680:437-1552(+)